MINGYMFADDLGFRPTGCEKIPMVYLGSVHPLPASNLDDKEFPIDPRKEFLNIDKNAYASILDEVKSYFDALKYCVDVLNENEEINKQLHFIQPPKKNSSGTYSWLREQDNNVVLPLIGYIQKFKQPQKLNAFIRRIRRNWFDSIRNRHMSGEPASNTYFVDWRYVLQIIEIKTEHIENQI